MKKSFIAGVFLILLTFAAKWADTPSGKDCIITQVSIDHETNPITMAIYGQNFDCEDLTVTLGDYGALYVTFCSTDPDEIVAELPSGIPGGDYLLTIQTGPSVHEFDAYHLTIGVGSVGSEVDPIFANSPAFNINSTDIANWDIAYGWDDHSSAGYLTTFTETDPTVLASVKDGVSWTELTEIPAGFADGVDDDSSAGTVTQVNTGAGLTGGPINTIGTISIPSGGVTNSMLQYSSITVTADTGLVGGGTISLGGSARIGLNSSYASGSPYDGRFINAGGDTMTGNLHVIGDITYTGSIGQSSDLRLKENIVQLENAVDKITSIRGIYFNYKNTTANNREVGIIAQEAEKVLPEIVSKDSNGYRLVDYSKLTPLLIEAIKELKEENDNLREENDALRKELKAELEQLRERMAKEAKEAKEERS